MSRAILLLVALTPLAAIAQSANVVAGLQQDVAALRNEVRLLRSEIEEVREIQEKLEKASASAGAANAELTAINARILAVETAAADARKEDRAQILAQVDGKLASVTGNVNRALETQTARVNTVIKSNAAPRVATPAPAATTALPSDMPKSGVRYKVAFGDSVSKIARKHNSKSEWILAANRMNSNADLKADAVIFVPQPDSAE